jgi:signal peptidase I
MDPLAGPLYDSAVDVSPVAQEQHRISMRRRARIMIGLLFLLVLMGANLAIGSGKVRFEKVTSESMEPSLLVGDVLMCDANAAVQRYDIVVAKDPLEEGGELVKRVMGMPGDTILIDRGVLYVRGMNDRQYSEEYSAAIQGNKMYSSDGRWTIHSDQVFLMGDNRNNSADSRDFGPVPMESIDAVVTSIIWPPARWRKPHPYRDETGE